MLLLLEATKRTHVVFTVRFVTTKHSMNEPVYDFGSISKILLNLNASSFQFSLTCLLQKNEKN